MTNLSIGARPPSPTQIQPHEASGQTKTEQTDSRVTTDISPTPRLQHQSEVKSQSSLVSKFQGNSIRLGTVKTKLNEILLHYQDEVADLQRQKTKSPRTMSSANKRRLDQFRSNCLDCNLAILQAKLDTPEGMTQKVDRVVWEARLGSLYSAMGNRPPDEILAKEEPALERGESTAKTEHSEQKETQSLTRTERQERKKQVKLGKSGEPRFKRLRAAFDRFKAFFAKLPSCFGTRVRQKKEPVSATNPIYVNK